MQRSEVNDIIRAADAFIRSFGFILPPFAYWSPQTMRDRRAEIDGIVDARLGWDITDYGEGRFDTLGLFLFTVRNGSEADLRRGGGMCYAEKIMISRQRPGVAAAPAHREGRGHHQPRRGDAGAAASTRATPRGTSTTTPRSTVATDGVVRRQGPGEVLLLDPGESVTLMPGNWHEFWGEGGDVLIGEVSTVNNDLTDNIFAEPIGRFAEIEEDEDPLHLLVSDYPRWFG